MMTLDIVQQRLHNQHLLGAPFARPEQVVQWFGAVQAQELCVLWSFAEGKNVPGQHLAADPDALDAFYTALVKE